jgi:hypothetical protein
LLSASGDGDSKQQNILLLLNCQVMTFTKLPLLADLFVRIRQRSISIESLSGKRENFIDKSLEWATVAEMS